MFFECLYEESYTRFSLTNKNDDLWEGLQMMVGDVNWPVGLSCGGS